MSDSIERRAVRRIIDSQRSKEQMLAVLESLPSVQPETHDKHTETNACDCINRQQAIDAIDEHEFAMYCPKDEVTTVLNDLPSAQPEIIRCEDCMHNGSFDTDCPIGWNGKEYCSFAERREDG